MIRIVFFGTPKLAIPFLQTLYNDDRFSLVGIVAQPDAPIGRKQILTPPPTAVFAKEHEILLLQPTEIKGNDEFRQSLNSINADVFIVYAYGKILPADILNTPSLGTINVHPSRLPSYRGPTPIQSAIKNGDTRTAISIMQIDAKMDHGPILATLDIDITPNNTYEEIESQVSHTGPALLTETLYKFYQGEIIPTPQDHKRATYCSLLTRSDGYISLQDTAQDIYNKWRAYHIWPGITFATNNNTRYKIHQMKLVETSTHYSKWILYNEEDNLLLEGPGGLLQIIQIQEQGRSPMDAKTFINGLQGKQIRESLKEMS